MTDQVMFEVHYWHCGKLWIDEWDSACNDKCSICNKEIEPFFFREIPMTDVDRSAVT